MTFGCVSMAKVSLTGDAAKVAEHLSLNNRELCVIKFCFEMIDIDGSSTIDYDEFVAFIEDQRSPFSDAVRAEHACDPQALGEKRLLLPACRHPTRCCGPTLTTSPPPSAPWPCPFLPCRLTNHA